MAPVFVASQLQRVRDFYRLTGYNGGLGPSDVVVGAARGDELIGAVRLANEQGTQVLRGMRIKPQLQRQGIGKQILEEVRLLLQGKECFAIAFAHLEDFYGRIGFRKIDEQQAPAFLRERIATYRQRNPQRDFILIRKAG